MCTTPPLRLASLDTNTHSSPRAQLITSNAAIDLFIYEANYVTGTANKIGLTYQLTRAAFNLLDTGKEGCVNVRNLRANEQIVGELGVGEELFNCFGGLEYLYQADMVLVLARWVGVIEDDVEGEGAGKRGGAENSDDDMSMNGGKDSDMCSTSGDSNKDADGDSGDAADGSASKKKTFAGMLMAGLRGRGKSVKLEDELLKRLSMDYADNIEGIFSAYDVDNSGSIDRDEFGEMVRHLFGNKAFSQADIDRSFNFFDIDKTEELLKHIFQMTLLDYRDTIEASGASLKSDNSRAGEGKKRQGAKRRAEKAWLQHIGVQANADTFVRNVHVTTSPRFLTTSTSLLCYSLRSSQARRRTRTRASSWMRTAPGSSS